MQCGKAPGFTKLCDPGGTVYNALECDCKTTPYYRSRFMVETCWETETYRQTPKEAFDKAIKDSAPEVTIYRPAHAQ